VPYRVEFQPAALRQLNGFPGVALDALVSAMADVTQYPDDPLRTVGRVSRVPAHDDGLSASSGGAGYRLIGDMSA
jgi:hypothetical protein